MQNNTIESSCSIGIDLGGTYIKYAVVDSSSKIHFQGAISTEADRGKEHVLDTIHESIQKCMEYSFFNNLLIEGIGIGTPGIVDQGLILGGADNLPQWENIPLKSILESRFNIQVEVDNDANTMAMGEIVFGAAKGFNDVIFLTVGTGIGGAMYLDKKLYSGHRNRGGELGHIIISDKEDRCTCGAQGCLEVHACVPKIISNYQKKSKDFSPLEGVDIVEKYLAKDPHAIEAMNYHFDYLAKGIASFINIFSPQKIVVGGGISECGAFYIQNIRERVFQYCMKDCAVFTHIETAALGNKAGVLGAAALLLSKQKENSTYQIY